MGIGNWELGVDIVVEGLKEGFVKEVVKGLFLGVGK